MGRNSCDCESNRTPPPLCCLPCLPKSKEDAGGPGSTPRPAAVAEEKASLVRKIEAAAAGGGDDEEGYKEVPVAPKSSLKRAGCAGGKKPVKGSVKWVDLLGKDLAQVREFEPSESGDSDDEDASPCTCVIL